VREDALTLYGFLTPADREAFLLVQTASGVGPKLALAILAVLDAPGLGQAIAQGNLNALVRVPGVGKKVAERLVVELRDKATLLAALADDAAAPAPAAGDLWRDQVVAGLTGLGYSAKDAERAVAAVDGQLPAGAEPSTAAYMKAALKHLAR
jgi:Holliday junction DNA helicase RuvA